MVHNCSIVMYLNFRLWSRVLSNKGFYQSPGIKALAPKTKSSKAALHFLFCYSVQSLHYLFGLFHFPIFNKLFPLYFPFKNINLSLKFPFTFISHREHLKKKSEKPKIRPQNIFEHFFLLIFIRRLQHFFKSNILIYNWFFFPYNNICLFINFILYELIPTLTFNFDILFVISCLQKWIFSCWFSCTYFNTLFSHTFLLELNSVFRFAMRVSLFWESQNRYMIKI